MNNATPEEFNELVTDVRPRTIKLVISDDGNQKFTFTAEGDLERIGKIPTDKYSAAEYWGVSFFNMCESAIKDNAGIKKMNREERRKS